MNPNDAPGDFQEALDYMKREPEAAVQSDADEELIGYFSNQQGKNGAVAEQEVVKKEQGEPVLEAPVVERGYDLTKKMSRDVPEAHAKTVQFDSRKTINGGFEDTEKDAPEQVRSSTRDEKVPQELLFKTGERLAGRYRVVQPRPTMSESDLQKKGHYLAHGGMGVVYKVVRDTLPDRVVTLKIMFPDDSTTHQSQESAARGILQANSALLEEAQDTQRVKHPNVCDVIDADLIEGREGTSFPFYVMPFYEGGTLEDRIAHRHAKQPHSDSSWKKKIRDVTTRTVQRFKGEQVHMQDDKRNDYGLLLFKKLSGALGAAHAAGLKHFDVKPGNILFDADGEPKLIDFGLAKVGKILDRGDSSSGAPLVGTPSYMSPEQANQQSTLNERTDQYGLGATWYHYLTGVQQFSHAGPASSLIELLDRIITSRLPPVHALENKVPLGVSAIVEKMMAREPSERYASMDAVVEDIDRVLAGEIPLARDVSKTWRAANKSWLWMKSHPVISVVTALGLSIGSVVKVNNIQYERESRKIVGDALAQSTDVIAGVRSDVAPVMSLVSSAHERAVEWQSRMQTAESFEQKTSLERALAGLRLFDEGVRKRRDAENLLPRARELLESQDYARAHTIITDMYKLSPQVVGQLRGSVAVLESTVTAEGVVAQAAIARDSARDARNRYSTGLIRAYGADVAALYRERALEQLAGGESEFRRRRDAQYTTLMHRLRTPTDQRLAHVSIQDEQEWLNDIENEERIARVAADELRRAPGVDAAVTARLRERSYDGFKRELESVQGTLTDAEFLDRRMRLFELYRDSSLSDADYQGRSREIIGITPR